MENAILYQSYGGMDFINECRFSLLKYLQLYNLNPPASTGIYIYTDQPPVFSDFLPFIPKLVCYPVDESTVIKWKGPLNFVHRFKIEMLRDFCSRFNGNVLYCDTDTYALGPLEEIFSGIGKGEFFMHEYEGTIDKTKIPSFRKWERFLSTTTLDYNGKQVQFNTNLQMFNAGVIGINTGRQEILNDVLALSDSVYEKFPKHIAEQFAFSYCFQQAGTILPAQPRIAHYWNLKEFRQLLAGFFSRNVEESIPSLVKKLHQLDPLAIMQEKNSFNRLPFFRRLFRKINGSAWRISNYEKNL